MQTNTAIKKFYNFFPSPQFLHFSVLQLKAVRKLPTR